MSCDQDTVCMLTHTNIAIITRHFDQGKDGSDGVTLNYLQELLGKSAKLVTDHVGVMGATVQVIKDLKKDKPKAKAR